MSPIIPFTPLQPWKETTTQSNSPYSLVPPQTPFTPFTAPLLKADDSTIIPNFEDNSLGQFYTVILRFLDYEIRPLIVMSEELNTRHIDDRGSEERFDILSNVVWEQLGQAIMDELGATVFAVGRPDEFQKVTSSI